MIKKLLTAVITLLLHLALQSQSCLPGGITFTTQVQIDNFQVDYPGCTVIGADVEILSQDIKNLNGLNQLEAVNGNLVIQGTLLMNLNGLNNLDSIGGILEIGNNQALNSLTGLGNLATVHGLTINNNLFLTSTLGLTQLSTLQGDFYISENLSLSHIFGLNNLTEIGGGFIIASNTSLVVLNLENLTSVGGPGFMIINNPLLVDMNLSSLDFIGGDLLIISDNGSLSGCAIQGLCTYLLQTPEYADIVYNGPGCDSPEEVEQSCSGVPVSASVRIDNDGDCQQDADDPAVEGVQIRLSGNLQMSMRATEADGSAQFNYVDSGPFSLFLPQFPTLSWAVCQDTIQVNPDTAGGIINAAFLLRPISFCPQLSVELGLPSAFRGCLVSSNATVTVRNTGTLVAEGVQVAVVIPSSVMELVTATPPPSTQSGDTLFFDAGALQPFAKSTISMTVKTKCDTFLIGQTLCLEAFATLDNPCPETGLAYSEVRLFSQCIGDTTVRFTLKNVGDAPTLNLHEYVIIEDEVILRSAQDFNLNAQGTMVVEVPADGSTYRMEATKYDNGTLTATAIENCGGLTPGFITAYWLDEGLRNYDFDCREVIGSYDPNQKTVVPAGAGPEHLLPANRPLQYTIDFQNTGTDTAFRVLLRDILPPQLDINTFRPGFASHTYTWQIGDAGALEVLFFPIALPDSNVNEAGSHGFFSFEIDQNPDLPDGTTIQNKASIIFDYNPPILTNTVLHTIGKLTVHINEAQRYTDLWKVSGNPARASATFQAMSFIAGEKRFMLSDASGRLVRSAQFSGQTFEFQRGGLPGGLYFFRISDWQGRIFSGKIVLAD